MCMEIKPNDSIAFIGIVLTGILASGFMYWFLKDGPGISPDSTIYIETAKNLTAGNGFLYSGKPMNQYPPVYPVLIAAVEVFNNSRLIESTRILCAIIFGTNLFLFGFAVYLCTKRCLITTICAVLFYLTSPLILEIHSMAWSEGPFIAFSLAAMILFSFHAKRPSFVLLLSASFAAGAALATRYIGFTLLPPIIVSLLFLNDSTYKEKFKNVLISMTLIVLPLTLWIARNIIYSSEATNRKFAVHSMRLTDIKMFTDTSLDFIMPFPVNAWFRIAFLLVLFILLAVYTCSRHKDITRRLKQGNDAGTVFIRIALIFFTTYCIFIGISKSFFDTEIVFDFRMLLPALIPFAVLCISILWTIFRSFDKVPARACMVVLFLILIFFNGKQAYTHAIDIRENGRDYSSWYWKNLEIIRYLKEIHEDRVIYSNSCDAIRFLTGKEAVSVPKKFSSTALVTNEGYQKQFNQMITECVHGKVLIAYLNDFSWRTNLPSIKEIECIDSLPVFKRCRDGIIYGR